MNQKAAFILLGIILFSSCSVTPNFIISPEGITEKIFWTREELGYDVVVKVLSDTPVASYLVIRLRVSERPHAHDHHDLVVFVLSGKALVHLKDKVIEVKKGDIIEIPRGIPHWAEIINNTPIEVFAVFTPSYDGKDHRFVEAK